MAEIEADLPVMPLYVEAFLGSPRVARMRGMARGAYLQLLVEEWRLRGAGLPTESWELAAAVRLSPEAWDEIAEEVLACFTLCPDFRGGGEPRYVNTRLETELERATEQKRRRSARGRSAAKKRWQSA